MPFVGPKFVNLMAAKANPAAETARMHSSAINFFAEKRIGFFIFKAFVNPL